MKRENLQRANEIHAIVTLKEQQLNAIKGATLVEIKPEGIPSNVENIVVSATDDTGASVFVCDVIDKMKREIDSLLKEMEEL